VSFRQQQSARPSCLDLLRSYVPSKVASSPTATTWASGIRLPTPQRPRRPDFQEHSKRLASGLQHLTPSSHLLHNAESTSHSWLAASSTYCCDGQRPQNPCTAWWFAEHQLRVMRLTCASCFVCTLQAGVQDPKLLIILFIQVHKQVPSDRGSRAQETSGDANCRHQRGRAVNPQSSGILSASARSAHILLCSMSCSQPCPFSITLCARWRLLLDIGPCEPQTRSQQNHSPPTASCTTSFRGTLTLGRSASLSLLPDADMSLTPCTLSAQLLDRTGQLRLSALGATHMRETAAVAAAWVGRLLVPACKDEGGSFRSELKSLNS